VVLFIDQHYGELADLGGDGVLEASRFLLLHEERLAGSNPFLLDDDLDSVLVQGRRRERLETEPGSIPSE
jgi:hypothetical protein